MRKARIIIIEMVKNKKIFLTESEITLKRTPDDLNNWVEQKLLQFKNSKEARKASLLHKGLFKKFYEEVRPLSLFAKHLYSGRTDIYCQPFLGNQNYDAIISDLSKEPETQLFVEFTCSEFDHKEILRMEYFLQHGHVNLTGKIYRSNKGHAVINVPACTSKKETIDTNLNKIKERAIKKSVENRYGPNHFLIIVFDDYLVFKFPKDHEDLKSFVKKELLSLNLDFRRLYLLGVSGKNLFSFELGMYNEASVAPLAF